MTPTCLTQKQIVGYHATQLLSFLSYYKTRVINRQDVMMFCIKEMFLVESRSTYQYYLNKRTSCSDRCFIAAVDFDALMACIEIVYNTGA